MIVSLPSALGRQHSGAPGGRFRALAAAAGVLCTAAVVPVALSAPAYAQDGCTVSGATATCTYTFTGATQTLTVPAGTIVTITADGAGGADNTGTSCSVTGTGGKGARVITTLPQSTAATTFTLDVGGTGGKGCNGTGTGGAGGFNGGAPGGAFPATGFRFEGPGGGGASSVSTGASLLVVAGGGGAAGGTGAGATGGNGGNGGTTPDAAGGTAGVATGPGASPGQGGGGGSTGSMTGGSGGPAGTAPPCATTKGGQGGGFAGATVGTGGAGGSIGGGCALSIMGAGGGGGGGYFAGGGGGSSAVNNQGLAAGGGGGGGGSSFATATGSGTSYALSTIGTANDNGQVTISYTLPATSTSVTSNPNPSLFGQSVTLTATVTGNAPTGTVDFTTGTTTLCAAAPLNGSGVATCTTSALPVGNDTVTATYSGDLGNASSHGSTTQSVATATTALTAAPATATLISAGLVGVRVSGLSATLTYKATGAPIPGQTITFASRASHMPLCTAVTNANGTASCTATFNNGYAGNILAVDYLVIFGYTATYTPTPGYTGSSANGRVTLGTA